ncbi:hypothetical protein MVEG_08187 [Podila verticillata NRRL 6337]|nr:hypothetical protein MVEG_08187 [Podila verticillata NRRL 6337]
MSAPEIQNPAEGSLLDTPPFEAMVYTPTAKPKPPLTEEEWANQKKPKVLIVGAGIGGLMLGNLLQKGGVPYDIYERAKEVKSLGSAMKIGGNIAPAMEQLSLWEELQKIGKPYKGMEIFSENLKLVVSIDSRERETLCGKAEIIVARPDLYDVLLRQIPKERIHLGKKVMSTLQNENGVMIRCADDSTAHIHGDILVGADGAHSAVRQNLYGELMRNKKDLPASDNAPLPYTCICLVGQTEVLDPEEFPDLKKAHSHCNSILGSSQPINWTTFTTERNTICWIVVQFLGKESAKKNDSFRNSEWGPEAAEAMCKEVRDFKLPGGKDGALITLGDLIDRTPKDLISKVMLEEKVFDTWYGGRTVLLGDACHKLNPSGGVGAVTAMHDAIALANWICTLESKEQPDIEAIFKEYKAERYPVAKEAFDLSRQMRNLGGKNLVSIATRQIFRHMPKFLWHRVMVKGSRPRPQASFLPQVTDNGTTEVLYQPSLHKTLAILKKRADQANSTKDNTKDSETVVI